MLYFVCKSKQSQGYTFLGGWGKELGEGCSSNTTQNLGRVYSLAILSQLNGLFHARVPCRSFHPRIQGNPENARRPLGRLLVTCLGPCSAKDSPGIGYMLGFLQYLLVPMARFYENKQMFYFLGFCLQAKATLFRFYYVFLFHMILFILFAFMCMTFFH